MGFKTGQKIGEFQSNESFCFVCVYVRVFYLRIMMFPCDKSNEQKKLFFTILKTLNKDINFDF